VADSRLTPFNSALETGIRSLAILVAAYPRAHDLQRLVQYDYLTVHSEDAGGPPSLHPALPLRSGELLVRRGNVERGLLLMLSARLVRRWPGEDGFSFGAEDAAGAFMANLVSGYHAELKSRARWVVGEFDSLAAVEFDARMKGLFEDWTVEFQSTHPGSRSGTQA